LDRILYVDEIISGGMLMGHTNEMVGNSGNPLKKGILRDRVLDKEIELFVFGLAHAHGKTFGPHKQKKMRYLVKTGLVDFNKFPIQDLVTEDQRFLLGLHYLLNRLGPHTIPFIDSKREYTLEHKQFWKDVSTYSQIA
jgi:hypothetical protein